MERSIAERRSKELKVDITQVVREYYEILVLKGLSSFTQSKCIIFKGGTALRLVYDSPRFSEDIDFSLASDCIKEMFPDIIKRTISPFPECEITDLTEKHFTYLAEIKISKEYLDLPFRIKIEVSKRIDENYKWELQVVRSPCSIYSVLLKTATLTQLYKDKQLCLRDRAKPKDLFDFWYISQLLKKPYKPDVQIDGRILKRDLRKFLPLTFHDIIEKL